MTVNQETFQGHSAASTSDDVEDVRSEEAPALEYTAVRQDSLAMFGAAVGGAILGTLLTLLVLAIINGGTLRFNVTSTGETLSTLEQYTAAVSQNVNSNSENINRLNEEFNNVATAFASEIARQNGRIGDIDESISTLDITRQQFGALVTALSDAMISIQELDSGTIAGDEGAAGSMTGDVATEEAATDAAAGGAALDEAAMVNDESFADIPAGAVVVSMGDASADVSGLMAVLLDAEGNEVGSQEIVSDGAMFEELDAGIYTLNVLNDDGSVLSEGLPLEMVEDAEAGQLVTIEIASE